MDLTKMMKADRFDVIRILADEEAENKRISDREKFAILDPEKKNRGRGIEARTDCSASP